MIFNDLAGLSYDNIHLQHHLSSKLRILQQLVYITFMAFHI